MLGMEIEYEIVKQKNKNKNIFIRKRNNDCAPLFSVSWYSLLF